MKRFVLIFEKLLNVHLVKDVGQVPFLLAKHFNMATSIACMKIDRYSHLEQSVQGLKLDFIRSSFFYLLFNARSIDICMLFHIRAKTVYQGWLYKLLNPHGFLYVKADLNTPSIPLIEPGRRNCIAQAYNRMLYRCFTRIVDLVSFETLQVFDAIDSLPAHKKLYLPNGFDSTLPERLGILPRPVNERSNVILCVARHGSQQKNSELLLQALERIDDLGSWRVICAGVATEEFTAYCDNFRKRCPRHADKIVLTGEITDRTQMLELFRDAKIFCMPSRWESWGLVCTEALYFGCAVVMTREILSAPDLSDNGKAALLAGNEDAVEWAAALHRLMNSPDLIEQYARMGREHFDRHFSWPGALQALTDRLPSAKEARP